MSPDEIRRSWDDDDTPRSVFPEPLAERLTRENKELRQGLWDTWAALGYDTDGDTGPDAWIAGSGLGNFIATVVKDAAEFRRQQEDDYDADTARLEARHDALVSDLRALATEAKRWTETKPGQWSTTYPSLGSYLLREFGLDKYAGEQP